MVLLALASWRAHAMSWWQSALVGIGTLLGVAAGEGLAGVVVTLPLCLGMLIAARRLS